MGKKKSGAGGRVRLSAMQAAVLQGDAYRGYERIAGERVKPTEFEQPTRGEANGLFVIGGDQGVQCESVGSVGLVVRTTLFFS
jgi:hypothetical protein